MSQSQAIVDNLVDNPVDNPVYKSVGNLLKTR